MVGAQAGAVITMKIFVEEQAIDFADRRYERVSSRLDPQVHRVECREARAVGL